MLSLRIKRQHPRIPEIQHRRHMHLSGDACGLLNGLGIAFAFRPPLYAVDHGQRLYAAHTDQPPVRDPFACQVTAVILPLRIDKSFLGTLHNPLNSNVNIRTSCHLSVHRQPAFIEIIEAIPIGPVWH